MIKVFLVEDETVIRNGIKNGIPWEEEGFEFVGEAADGELAYPLIKEAGPDILITDIRMPFMDGLELSENIKRELPDIKIIILSGYNEFDYAKQAIGIGITEYLLKPISSAKLLEAIKKVAKGIEKERAEKALRDQYLHEMQENTEFDKQKFFQRLITEEMPMTKALEMGWNLGMDLSAGKYRVILFKIMAPNPGLEYSEQVAEVTHRIEEIEDKKQVFCFRRGLEGWAFLLMAGGDEELQELTENYCEQLKSNMQQYEEVEYFGGVGRSVTRLREVKNSYYDADIALASRFVKGTDQIVYFEEMEKQEAVEIEIDGLGVMEHNREMIAKFLRSGVAGEVERFVEAYFAKMEGNQMNSMMLRQYIVIDSYITIMSFAEELGLTKEELERECGEAKELSQYVHSLTRTRQYIADLIKTVLRMRNSLMERKGTDTLAKAKEYIDGHYMTENISLNQVASYVNMSPSYFSTIFGQEAGQTFVEYLTSVRMEKAQELLMCSNMKTSEIGYEVGYKDSHYFSYIFKKTRGCSPKEYRMRRKES